MPVQQKQRGRQKPIIDYLIMPINLIMLFTITVMLLYINQILPVQVTLIKIINLMWFFEIDVNNDGIILMALQVM